jgi:hypothetical protein
MHEFMEQEVKPLLGGADIYIASSDKDLEKTIDYLIRDVEFDSESALLT